MQFEEPPHDLQAQSPMTGRGDLPAGEQPRPEGTPAPRPVGRGFSLRVRILPPIVLVAALGVAYVLLDRFVPTIESALIEPRQQAPGGWLGMMQALSEGVRGRHVAAIAVLIVVGVVAGVLSWLSRWLAYLLYLLAMLVVLSVAVGFVMTFVSVVQNALDTVNQI